jgi:hypothetical protein
MTAEFIKLTEKNIPETEVIAINKSNECLVGYISENENEFGFSCTTDHEVLYHVTHYSYIPKIH